MGVRGRGQAFTEGSVDSPSLTAAVQALHLRSAGPRLSNPGGHDDDRRRAPAATPLVPAGLRVMSSGGLGRTAARGLVVASGGNFATYAFSFGAAMVLARLLTPTDFGQVALAMTVADLLFITIGLSLPTALLREPADRVELAFRTSMTMMVIACCVAVIVGAGIAAGLATLVSGTVAALFAVIAFARMPPLFGLCLAADIQRRNAYGRFSTVVYGSQAFSLVVAVILAFAGVGVWALVAREAAAGVVLFAVAWGFSEWKIRFGFDREKCGELLRFGALMLGSRAGDIMFHKYDNLVVAGIAGTRELGLYNQSYVLAELSNRVYAPVIFTVPINMYAQLQGDRARTTRMYQLTMFGVVRSVLPLGVLIVIFPGEILAVAFGSQWTAGADMLRGSRCVYIAVANLRARACSDDCKWTCSRDLAGTRCPAGGSCSVSPRAHFADWRSRCWAGRGRRNDCRDRLDPARRESLGRPALSGLHRSGSRWHRRRRRGFGGHNQHRQRCSSSVGRRRDGVRRVRACARGVGGPPPDDERPSPAIVPRPGLGD